MGTIPFSAYLASRPTANTPFGANDRVMILQDGAVKLVAPTEVGSSVTSVLIDASITPVTLLPASGEIVYVKSDDSADVAGFAVSVVGQTMCQELQNGLANTGESIRVKLIGVNWYKIA